MEAVPGKGGLQLDRYKAARKGEKKEKNENADKVKRSNGSTNAT